jgi:plastocyanin
MTTTETDGTEAEAQPDETAPTPPAGGEPPDEAPALESGDKPRDEVLWTRGILPLALPVLAVIALAVWVVNLSRTFLAGGKDGALVIVLIVTITIMAGASLMSASTRMSTGKKIIAVSVLVWTIIAAGIITFGPSEPKEKAAGGYKQPKGDAVATIEASGGPGYTYGAKEFRVPAGIIEIDFIDKGEQHTLNFTDPKFTGFELLVPGKENKGKVDLKPGTYTIYCKLSGHRAGGMEATIVAE